MKRVLYASLTALSVVGPGLAQSPAGTAIVTQLGSPADFCFYNGLAFSENAMLTVDIANRRESPQATQKAMLLCVRNKDTANLVWERMDNE